MTDEQELELMEEGERLLEEFRRFAISTYPSLQNDWDRMLEKKSETKP